MPWAPSFVQSDTVVPATSLRGMEIRTQHTGGLVHGGLRRLCRHHLEEVFLFGGPEPIGHDGLCGFGSPTEPQSEHGGDPDPAIGGSVSPGRVVTQ